MVIALGVFISRITFEWSNYRFGTGFADFQLLASCLENINFTGDIVLEAARGIPGEELTWAKNNRSLVLKYSYGVEHEKSF